MESGLYPSLHHLIDCRYGGNCYNMSLKHQKNYQHPPYCPDNGYCRNMSVTHLLANRHVPICKYALQCRKKTMAEHAREYRHCNRRCPKGSFCVKFHNTFHTETLSHPFLTPCPLTPYNCSQHDELILNFPNVSEEIRLHCYFFSHVCYWGRQCKDFSEQHIQTYIHVARNLCPYDNQCNNLTNEDHLNSYSHSTYPDIRRPCKKGASCLQKQDSKHVTYYRHEDTHGFRVAPYFGFHDNTNYVENQCNMLARVNQYVFSEEHQNLIIPNDIINFIRVLQPMHRCKRDVFESILLQGHLMSLYYMDLLKETERVVNQIWTLMQGMVEVYSKQNLEQTVIEFIRSLVQNEFKIVGEQLTENLDNATDNHIQFCENKLKYSDLSQEEIDTIRERSVTVAKAALKLCNDRPGIQHGADKYFGTDKHVFGIFGPNLGHRYGDIMILFKREIMLHPDANFAIQAATTFGEKGRAYKWRPWLKDPNDLELRIEQFPLNVLHCSVENYEYAAAAELLAITAKELNQKSNDTSLEQVINAWMKRDPHGRFETHLPALIPLDYIDHVYMPESVFDSLSPEAQKKANEVFGSSLTVTPHKLSEDIQPKIDNLRAIYQDDVLNKIVDRFVQLSRNERNSEIEETHKGFVITLFPSKLETLVLIPIRISQSYTQFIYNNLQIIPHSRTFIYWQALGGDMMVILANEPIRTHEKQFQLSTLACYIADRNSTDTQEQYSYISGAPFYSHYTTKDPQNVYEVSSNTFHRGCNFQNYLTYCLQIEPSIGQVTLSHAGSDNIYNHEKLTYQFTKENLDLSSLDWVHISAGKRKVPIKNFIITNEPISRLHPSFDKNFNYDANIHA